MIIRIEAMNYPRIFGTGVNPHQPGNNAIDVQ
jgi:hypothetical protein